MKVLHLHENTVICSDGERHFGIDLQVLRDLTARNVYVPALDQVDGLRATYRRWKRSRKRSTFAKKPTTRTVSHVKYLRLTEERPINAAG